MTYNPFFKSATIVVTLTLAACGSSEPGIDQTGQTPDLPDQRQTLVPPMKIASPAPWNGEKPVAPRGYVVTAFATDLKVPRQALVLPNGDVLVAEGSGGSDAPKMRPKDVIAGYIKSWGKTPEKGGNRITLLRDRDGDGKAELRTTFIAGLNAPYGLAYVDGSLYVANQDALLRFSYSDGATRITSPGAVLTTLPSRINHHWTKSLTASADGTKLYVGIGSNSNVGERGMAVEEDRAVIWEIDRMTGAHRQFASGIRNPTALAIQPQTKALWAVVNERDELGPQLVPDYMTSVRGGAFYGWPYSYWGKNVDPRVSPQNPSQVAKAIRPDFALGSHVAALGLSFVSGDGLGGAFREGAFVGEHGSWNRQDLSGYKVVWVAFSRGRPVGKPVDFLTGFLQDGHARGRPVGVTYDPVGSALLVADDLSNTLWRVAPAPESRP
ncbi:sorbosone dehydrogenase family protein [Sphingobium phenoxybenzoativorans]|uniref:Sorbosone dehydrogenase family protein n=1 Tax=Sphingobium phenoxybenzoativorans TaxID=1592790 RepID=A0A975Q193_9SPHN|nr:sorbosone dehydrogenase family protein [Sphingobium phenoxybenzoativorans]QUT05173.1 sorbosone dehydrogenase family protein [Sphingobium phenoxybenzoativorans]